MSRARAFSHAAIHAVVRRIPRGMVATYGQVAALAGVPGLARRVGSALFALPEGSTVPWHRVVNAAGELSVARVDAGTALVQRQRLEREGVTFDARGRVDLARHGWRARPRGGAPRRGTTA